MPVLRDDPVAVQLVLGAQWGDEGKGKVVDLLGERSDIVARYQGGPNAGHTVRFGGDTFILHQLPSGILRPHAECMMGNGVVLHPDGLLAEIDQIEAAGLSVIPRLRISPAAHLILPVHMALDRAGEEEVSGEKIGTTGRGIGPAYADKANRTGLRVGMLVDGGDWEARVRQHTAFKNKILTSVYGAAEVDEGEVLSALRRFISRLGGCVSDVGGALRGALADGRRILLEGAQGALLDIDFGTYPFVTSSNTTTGGAYTGLGLPPRAIERVIGVVKAYTTRVGNGPFPTEIPGELGERLRRIGGEYGATTGRPRRCGWFDAVAVRYAVEVNGIDTLAVMKLDVLDGLDEIQVCTGYRLSGRIEERFPALCSSLDRVEPVTRTFQGWQESTAGVRDRRDLPARADAYLRALESLAGVPVRLLSVGAERDATVWC